LKPSNCFDHEISQLIPRKFSVLHAHRLLAGEVLSLALSARTATVSGTSAPAVTGPAQAPVAGMVPALAELMSETKSGGIFQIPPLGF